MSDFPRPDDGLVQDIVAAKEKRLHAFKAWCAELDRINQTVGSGFNDFPAAYFLGSDPLFGLPLAGITPRSKIILGGQEVVLHLLESGKLVQLEYRVKERSKPSMSSIMVSVAYDAESEGDIYLITGSSPNEYGDMKYRSTRATQDDLKDLVPAIIEGRLYTLLRTHTVTYPQTPILPGQ